MDEHFPTLQNINYTFDNTKQNLNTNTNYTDDEISWCIAQTKLIEKDNTNYKNVFKANNNSDEKEQERLWAFYD